MTNSEAILRLSVNKRDRLAMLSLHDNNLEIIRAALARYFETHSAADKCVPLLMLRIADQARLYEHSENPDAWLANCANTQCDRLRHEAIREKAYTG
ncbi:MAG TPA: hypothetical protein VFQ18_07035 [Candidatus Acidoferrum sp.]|nr:hypothetical protein [Candidatus Acidoferrum sp.]